MCLVGAKNNTHSELKSLLSYGKNLDDDNMMRLNVALLNELKAASGAEVSLSIANKIFPKQDYEIRKEFIKMNQEFFKSDVECLNYNDAKNSAKTINTWVANETKDKVKDLIDPNVIDEYTRLILVNAIYFKGNWLNKFDTQVTNEDDFHLENGSTVKVNMMRMSKKFKFLANPNGIEACACELPYAGNKIAMTIILPNRGVSLASIENKLEPINIRAFIQQVPLRSKVNLGLPRFKLEQKLEVALNKRNLFIKMSFFDIY